MGAHDVVVSVSGPRPGPSGDVPTVDLAAGQRLSFGSCPCRECGHGLVVPAPAGGFLAGAVTACADHWRLDNLSVAVLTCHDLEDPTQQVRLEPGRVQVAVPFELARVVFSGQPESLALTVFGPEPTVQSPGEVCRLSASQAPELNPAATYYRVLEELCRPRLEGGPAAPLPTSAAIARELNRRGVLVTRRAVDHHVDYLAERFGIAEDGPAQARGVSLRPWRREALVRAALRLGALSAGETCSLSVAH